MNALGPVGVDSCSNFGCKVSKLPEVKAAVRLRAGLMTIILLHEVTDDLCWVRDSVSTLESPVDLTDF